LTLAGTGRQNGQENNDEQDEQGWFLHRLSMFLFLKTNPR
jgi:hypothetical protein